MAKLHDKSSAAAAATPEPEDLLLAIQAFLHSCRRPAALEYGEEIIGLEPGQFTLELRGGRLWLDACDEARSLSRRILAIERRATGVLDCAVHRFGGKPGKLSLLDLECPQTAHKTLRGTRENFAEQFRRMLFRQFPGWEIIALSCGPDLQRSFSPVFPRARLRRGNREIAALACPSALDEPALLSFALIWHAHIRPSSLCLFLPETAGNLTAHRLHWLTGESLACHLFRFNAHGSAGEVDPRDLGNLQTRIKNSANAPVTPASARPGHPSERMLEAAVRSNITRIDPMLLASPIHGQTLAFAAGDRDLIDLLAVSSAGRLAVLELKVSEDLHLPIQALDYWMRIQWHAGRRELQHLFPEVPLANASAKLLLVAPAMSFHSTNAAILRYFSPEIEVERVGINSDWERQFKVVLRLSGAAMPISHGSF